MKKYISKKTNFQMSIGILFFAALALVLSLILLLNLAIQSNSNAFANYINDNYSMENSSKNAFEELGNVEKFANEENSNNYSEIQQYSMNANNKVDIYFATNGVFFSSTEVGENVSSNPSSSYDYAYVGDCAEAAGNPCVLIGPTDDYGTNYTYINSTLKKDGITYKFDGWRYVFTAGPPPNPPTKDNTTAMPNAYERISLTGSYMWLYLYGVYAVDEIDATFDGNGGKWLDQESQVITQKNDTNWKLPETQPTRVGYEFAGYFDAKTGGNQITSDMTVDGSVTKVYAHWNANKYLATFDKQDGIGGSDNVEAIYGEKLPSITIPTLKGHNFNGYYDAQTGGNKYIDKDGTGVKAWDKTSNTTLYAQWTLQTHQVTFDKNGHGTAPDPIASQEYGKTFSNPGTLNATGYTHDGKWYKEPTCTTEWKFDTDTMPDYDLTLYAKWTVKTYSITLSDTIGTGGQQTLDNVTFGQALPALTTLPTSPDYKLNGYFTSATGGTKYINSDGTSARIWDIDEQTPTLYAQWTLLGTIQFTINNYDGIYDAASHSISVNITKPNPSDCTIEYSTDGASWSATNPAFTDVSQNIVYVKISAENYKEANDSGTITISQKAVIVTANSAEKEFGNDDPELTATITGTLNSDPLEYNVSREEGEEVGEYQITPTGETSQGNYTVNFVNNVFTITQPEIVVNPDGSITVNKGTVAFSTEQEESDLNVRATQSTLELYTILSNGAISEDDLLKVAQGGSLEIEFVASKAELTEEEKAKFKDVTEGVVDCYTDISVSTQLTTAEGEEDPFAVTETSSPLKIEVDVPESMRQVPGTTYEVLRQHEDAIDVLENSFDADKNIITFGSDKFSNYAIAYKEPINPDNPGEGENINGTAQTGDSSFAIIAELGALAAAAVSVLVIRKRKNTADTPPNFLK